MRTWLYKHFYIYKPDYARGLMLASQVAMVLIISALLLK